MRCKFCGSKAIYPYKHHEQAGAGRVIAGAILAGPIGAVAGLAGKNVNGYRCSACGMFSEQPMDFGEEMLINSAITDAKNGNTIIYERYREKYANLEFVPTHQTVKQEIARLNSESYDEDYEDTEALPEAGLAAETVKHSYCPNQYIVGSPIFISNVTIKDDNGTDVLLLDINNISGKALRSVYLNITAYDDVGDKISTSTFAYQGLSAATGEALPQAKPFNLNTNVAYKVDVVCEKAAFTDDTVWRKEENPTIYSVPEKTELVSESFAQHKYLRVLLAKKGALRVGQKLYYPVVEETHRLCVCGNPAINGSKCLACGLSEADLQEVMDYDVLVQCRKDVIAKTAKERTNALQRFRDQALEETYQEAIRLKKEDTQESCNAAMEILASIGDYKDANDLCACCKARIEELIKDRIYAAGMGYMNHKAWIENYESAIAEFKKIPGWKDANEQIIVCQHKIMELEAKAEADRQERERKADIARAEAAAAAKRKKVITAIAAVAVCVAFAFIIILNAVIIPNNKYNDAIALMEAGNLDDAYSAFIELGDYKDAANKAGDIRLQKNKEQLKNIKVGSYINFGVYEQDNNTSNGKEEIEWLVLEVKDGKALVVSKYALDRKSYDTGSTGVTWETCRLRKWLNNEFINAAFSADEKAMIPTVTVSADKNPDYSTNPGKATQDQVFLLSITEANKYFSSKSARQCEATDYVDANGNCLWWLRSPGDDQYSAALVYDSGGVIGYGYGVDSGAVTVRPALWIDLSKI